MLMYTLTRWIQKSIIRQSGVAFSTDMKLKDIQKVIPRLKLVACRRKRMKGQNGIWGNKLILIPASEKDRQALIKLSVQFVIDPILDVNTRIKIEEFTSARPYNLCYKQLLYKNGCPHVNTNNVCIGNKSHLKKGIAEAINNFINEGKDYPEFVTEETYNYIISTINKLDRPKYLRVNNKFVGNKYKNAVLGIKNTKSLFSAKALDKKLKVVNILAHTEAEAKIEILNNLNARIEALDGISKIEINGEIINYNNGEKSGIILFKSQGDKIMFKKLIEVINTGDLSFDDFQFIATKSTLAKIEKVKEKTKVANPDYMEKRISILESRLDNLDLTVNNKLDKLLKQLANKPHNE